FLGARDELKKIVFRNRARTLALKYGRGDAAVPFDLSKMHEVESVFQVNSFIVAIEFERRWSLFLRSKARILGAAERQLIFYASARKIYRQQARFHLMDILENARNVRRLNRSGKAELAGVGDAHRILEIFRANDGEHRAEDFFFGNGRIFLDVREDGGFDEKAFVVGSSG